MSLEDAKNINMRPRFQSVLSVEKYETLHESGPYLISNLSSTLLFIICLQHTGLSAPWTTQGQPCLVVSYLCMARSFSSFNFNSNATSPGKPVLMLSSLLLLLSHLSSFRYCLSLDLSCFSQSTMCITYFLLFLLMAQLLSGQGLHLFCRPPYNQEIKQYMKLIGVQ